MFDGQYLDYNTYVELGGTLENTPFNILEYNARKKIDERTFGRLIGLVTVPNEVKLCVYQLINTLDGYSSFTSENKGIASENTDGYSVTYQKPSKEIIETQEKEISNTINSYLANTLVDNVPVLFRGTK